jgi:hypothetical protein
VGLFTIVFLEAGAATAMMINAAFVLGVEAVGEKYRAWYSAIAWSLWSGVVCFNPLLAFFADEQIITIGQFSRWRYLSQHFSTLFICLLFKKTINLI